MPKAKLLLLTKPARLTKGELVVDKVRGFGSFKSDVVLGAAAALEQNSNHVLALAIVGEAKRTGAKFQKAKNIQELAGSGLSATVGGKQILVGRLSLLEERGVKLPKSFSAKSLQQTAACVALDGQLAGVITFKDELRPGSQGNDFAAQSARRRTPF